MTDTEILNTADKVVRSFRGKFPPSVTAEDARQDACELILKWRDKFPNPAYLFTKVRGVLLDRYGRLWRQEYAHESVSLDVANDGEALPTEETTQVVSDVREAIGRLEPKQRAVMDLHLQGLTQKEIAGRLGVGQPYVSQIMKSARETLRGLLGDYS